MSSLPKHPNRLFHSSAFAVTELKPGFLITGEEVRWDETESNKFLYATEDKDFASQMGFATAIDKHTMMNEFHSKDDLIEIVLDKESQPMSRGLLKTINYYLYTIRFRLGDKWIKNENPINNAPNEWKTDRPINAILRVERISCMDYIKDKDLIIRHPRFPVVRILNASRKEAKIS